MVFQCSPLLSFSSYLNPFIYFKPRENERNMLAKHRPTFLGEGCRMLAEDVQKIATSRAMLRETYTAMGL